MKPVYKLKNCGERLARYSTDLTFLTECKRHGIIPSGLWEILPVRSTKKTGKITERTGLPSYERGSLKRISRRRCQHNIVQLAADLTQSLDADQWPTVNHLCKSDMDCVYKDAKCVYKDTRGSHSILDLAYTHPTQPHTHIS